MSWPEVQLRRIARFAYGDSLADAERIEGAVPVYGSNGQVGQHNRANTAGPAIVIGRKGSFGKLQFSANPVFAIDTTFFVDATRTDADLRWLYYALGTLRLDQLSEDVGVPGLSREKAYSQPLPLPPLHEQRAIADYLDRETARIDALVAAKRRMAEVVAERMRAVVDSAVWSGVIRPTPLMHLVDPRRPVMYGIVLPGPDVGDPGIAVVKGGDVAKGRLTWGELSNSTFVISGGGLG